MTVSDHGTRMDADTPDQRGSATRGHPIAASDTELFRAVYPGLRRFAAVWVLRGEDPDDLVQQAVANTLARGSLTALVDPAAYLRTAIANLARNQYAAKRADAVPSVELPAAVDDYPSDIAVLLEVSPSARAALFLVDVERMSYRDAAAILGCSAPALRARALRARRQVRLLLQAEVEG